MSRLARKVAFVPADAVDVRVPSAVRGEGPSVRSSDLTSEEGTMHAVLVSVSIDEGAEEQARKFLVEAIVPGVKQSPGFVAGYWMAPAGNKGWSVVLFDTEEHARAVAPPAGSRPMDAPVVVDHVEFREVIASA